MPLIDEINSYRVAEKNKQELESIIDINSDFATQVIYNCIGCYIKRQIIEKIKYNGNTRNHLFGIIYINNISKTTTLNSINTLSKWNYSDINNNSRHKFYGDLASFLPVTICCTDNLVNSIPKIYFLNKEIYFSPETEKQIHFAHTSAHIGSTIMYKGTNNICLYPLSFPNTGVYAHDSAKLNILTESFGDFEDFIIGLSKHLKNQFVVEGLKVNNIAVKTIDEVIPIKDISYYKLRLFRKHKFIKKEQLIPSNCSNKCIVFEMGW